MISINRFLIRKGFKSNDEEITILQMVELVDQWQRQVKSSLGEDNENPFLLSGDELKRTEKRRISGYYKD